MHNDPIFIIRVVQKRQDRQEIQDIQDIQDVTLRPKHVKEMTTISRIVRELRADCECDSDSDSNATYFDLSDVKGGTCAALFLLCDRDIRKSRDRKATQNVVDALWLANYFDVDAEVYAELANGLSKHSKAKDLTSGGSLIDLLIETHGTGLVNDTNVPKCLAFAAKSILTNNEQAYIEPLFRITELAIGKSFVAKNMYFGIALYATWRMSGMSATKDMKRLLDLSRANMSFTAAVLFAIDLVADNEDDALSFVKFCRHPDRFGDKLGDSKTSLSIPRIRSLFRKGHTRLLGSFVNPGKMNLVEATMACRDDKTGANKAVESLKWVLQSRESVSLDELEDLINISLGITRRSQKFRMVHPDPMFRFQNEVDRFRNVAATMVLMIGYYEKNGRNTRHSIYHPVNSCYSRKDNEKADGNLRNMIVDLAAHGLAERLVIKLLPCVPRLHNDSLAIDILKNAILVGKHESDQMCVVRYFVEECDWLLVNMSDRLWRACRKVIEVNGQNRRNVRLLKRLNMYRPIQ